jgi:hypothetical protein
MDGKKPKKKTLYQKLAPGQETYSSFDVSRIVNINRERLREWVKFGFTPIPAKEEEGRCRLLWGRNDLYSILLFKRLVDSGLRRKDAATYVHHIFWDEVKVRKEKYFLVSYNSSWPEKDFITLDKAKSLRGMKDLDIATYINLGRIIEYIDRRV